MHIDVIQTFRAISFLLLYHHNEGCLLWLNQRKCFAWLLSEWRSSASGGNELKQFCTNVWLRNLIFDKKEKAIRSSWGIILAQKQDHLQQGGEKWSVIGCLYYYFFSWALLFWWGQTLSALIQFPVRLQQTCTSEIRRILEKSENISLLRCSYSSREAPSLHTSTKCGYALFTLMKPL